MRKNVGYEGVRSRCYTSVRSVEKIGWFAAGIAIPSAKVLTGTFPLSSVTRAGPPRGKRRQDRAVPSCGPTRLAPCPFLCPFASPYRDPVPFLDPAAPSPSSPTPAPAAVPSAARSPCSSLASCRVLVPGSSPTLFHPEAAKAATLQQTKYRLVY